MVNYCYIPLVAIGYKNAGK